MKYSMFIGRWQPLHKGHLWLINQRLKRGKKVWLAIRDVAPDKNNPWTASEIEKMIDPRRRIKRFNSRWKGDYFNNSRY